MCRKVPGVFGGGKASSSVRLAGRGGVGHSAAAAKKRLVKLQKRLLKGEWLRA